MENLCDLFPAVNPIMYQMHIMSYIFAHHGDFGGRGTIITCVIICIYDVVFLSGIIVISHSRRTLVLALISQLILLYICLASYLVTIESTPHLHSAQYIWDCRVEMAITRSVTRKQDGDTCNRKRSVTRKKNHDARKRSKTHGNGGSAPWADLCYDLLFLLTLKLGIVDFISFRGVCKAWRKVAESNRKFFMETRRPMAMSLSSGYNRKMCYLKDQEGRMFKTVLPRSSHRKCVGLTCGYLILFGRETHDFMLVNPITRHELHFPRFPYLADITPGKVRAVLVPLPSVDKWVFVFSIRPSGLVSFALSGKISCWKHIMPDFPIYDLHTFQGKIYAISTHIRLYEVKLDSKPTLTLLKMKTPHKSSFLHPELVSLGGRLYVINWFLGRFFGSVGVDFNRMEWVKAPKTITESSYFLSQQKHGALTNLVIWDDPRTQYERFGYFNDSDKGETKGKRFYADMWYLPHDCLDVNNLDE